MSQRLSQAEQIARQLDPPEEMYTTEYPPELAARIAPRPPVAKLPPYVATPPIEAMLSAGASIEEIAQAKVDQCRPVAERLTFALGISPAAAQGKVDEYQRVDHLPAWLVAVRAVAALAAAAGPEPAPIHDPRLPELALPPRAKLTQPVVEDLVSQRVPRTQATAILCRFWRVADERLAGRAFDLVAAALSVRPPASAQGAMSEAGQVWNKAAHSVGEDDELPMPLVGGMPKPLDTLNAIVADEARQRAGRAAEQQEHASW